MVCNVIQPSIAAITSPKKSRTLSANMNRISMIIAKRSEKIRLTSFSTVCKSLTPYGPTGSILSRILVDDHIYQGRAGLLHGLFDCRFNGVRLFDSLAENTEGFG